MIRIVLTFEEDSITLALLWMSGIFPFNTSLGVYPFLGVEDEVESSYIDFQVSSFSTG